MKEDDMNGGGKGGNMFDGSRRTKKKINRILLKNRIPKFKKVRKLERRKKYQKKITLKFQEVGS